MPHMSPPTARAQRCTTYLTMAQRLWMGSMILEDVLQANAKRVVEE